jgi:hypothetical protein
MRPAREGEAGAAAGEGRAGLPVREKLGAVAGDDAVTGDWVRA